MSHTSLQDKTNGSLITFFRHRIAKRIATSDVHRRRKDGRASDPKGSRNGTKKEKGETGKRTDGKPKPMQARRMNFKEADKRDSGESGPSSSDDLSSTATDNKATSRKRVDVKKAPPRTTVAEPTRKSTRNRQATLTKALGNPIPINIMEPPKHLNSVTGTTKTKSIKNLIHEMGFEKDSLELVACVKLFENIRTKTNDNINVIDIKTSKHIVSL